MSVFERREFLASYEDLKSLMFDNKQVLVAYCQDYVSGLRQLFRREFIHKRNIDVFLESITIASASKTLLRKRFLKTDTVGLIRTGGYTWNNRFSKKPSYGWCIGKRQTDVRYFTVSMDASADCQKSVPSSKGWRLVALGLSTRKSVYFVREPPCPPYAIG